MRLAIAEHMVRSKRTSPHATTVVEVDMTNIAKWLEKNKEDFKRRDGYGISYISFCHEGRLRGHSQIPHDEFKLDRRQQDHRQKAYQPRHGRCHRCRPCSANNL
ncbi:MAG TPA: hypothetical protein DCL75_12945 [Ktedonobacter sp.]|nr:hypothetical protein [Ktedonobacter sp.]